MGEAQYIGESNNTMNYDALLAMGKAHYIGGVSWLTSRLKGYIIWTLKLI
jgi:hypothetical protein